MCRCAFCGGLKVSRDGPASVNSACNFRWPTAAMSGGTDTDKGAPLHRDAACWFYGRAPLLGVGKQGEYTRLCPADCAALDAAHAARAGALSRTSPCSPPEGPTSVSQPGVVVRSGLWEADEPLRYLRPCYPLDVVTPPLALVRSTWFVETPPTVVGVGSRKAGDLLPIGEVLCHQLDASAATAQPGAGRPAVRIGGPGLPAELRVYYITPDEAWLAQDNLASRVADALLNSTRDPSRGVPPIPGALRLRRGFNPSLAAPLGDEEAGDAGAAAAGPVSHLVLSTHGIGHGLEFVNTATTAASLRSMLRATPGGAGCVPQGRVMLLPVQWRKGLALSSDTGALDVLVPDAAAALPLRSLRVVLNFLVCDVLSYVASDGDRMAEALVQALNDVVARFRARNRGFVGPVSVVAHSLGSVLMFDLMNQMGIAAHRGHHHSPPRTPGAHSPDEEASPSHVAALMAENAALRAALEAPARHAPTAKSSLAFEVDTLVMLGSPLGLFLALRGQPDMLHPPRTRLACRRLVNVMHPLDPVSYRLEPLAWPHGMSTVTSAATTVAGATGTPGAPGYGPPPKPVDVSPARGVGATAASRRVAAEAAATLRGVGAIGLTNALRGRVNAMAAAVITGAATPTGNATSPAAVPMSDQSAQAAHTRACDTLKLLSGGGVAASGEAGNGADGPAGALSGRVDFLLASADANPLTAFLSAHNSYWTCPDTAMLIMKACGPTLVPAAAASSV